MTFEEINVSKTEAQQKRDQEKKIVKERTADTITLQSIKADNSVQRSSNTPSSGGFIIN